MQQLIKLWFSNSLFDDVPDSDKLRNMLFHCCVSRTKDDFLSAGERWLTLLFSSSGTGHSGPAPSIRDKSFLGNSVRVSTYC
jgi:hypothetical protein